MSATGVRGPGRSDALGRPARPGSSFRDDPDLTDRRGWGEALGLAAKLGLPFGVIPAALLLELAPQLGFLRPSLWSFGGIFALFVALARAPHRAVPWVVAGAISALLVVGAVLTTAWTLTQTVSGAW